MKAGLAFVGVLLVPGLAAAQPAAQTWSELRPAGWSTVYVLDDAGVETTGRFLRTDRDSLVLLVGGREVRIDAARVERIQKRGDSLRNGAIIGALVGAGVGLVVSRMADCPDARGSCPGFRVAALATSTAVYAGIGAGIDALVTGRTTVYEARTGPSRVAAVPRDLGLGIRVRLRW